MLEGNPLREIAWIVRGIQKARSTLTYLNWNLEYSPSY